MSPDRNPQVNNPENQYFSSVVTRRNFLRGVGIIGGLAATGWTGYDLLKMRDQVDNEVKQTIPSMPQKVVESAEQEVTIFKNELERAARQGDLSQIPTMFNGQVLKKSYTVLDQDRETTISKSRLFNKLFNRRANLFSRELNAGKRDAVIGILGTIIASVSLVYGDNKASNVSIT